MKLASVFVAFLFVACGGTQAPAPQAPPEPAEATKPTAPVDSAMSFGAFTAVPPESWQKEAPSSKMRVAQFTIGDAELIVYYFGAGGAGGTEANIQRWYSQFEQPDGSDTATKAKTNTLTIAGFAVTLVDVSGRYVAAVRPGAPEKHDKPDQRMLAAIVETPSGPYFFKLLGPAATIEKTASDFEAFLASIKPSEGHGANGEPHGTP